VADSGGAKQAADSASELERAMAATMKKLEAEASQTVEGESADDQAEKEQSLKQRQTEKFRELLRDKVIKIIINYLAEPNKDGNSLFSTPMEE